jgi:hypothetical protein
VAPNQFLYLMKGDSMEQRKDEKPCMDEKPRKDEKKDRFQIMKLEERIAPSNANFPPGQFPSGNPAQAPGK